ncbi:MAG: ABC transporter ATP-binding protein [Bacilli bacterium]|jgi:ABC-2 type transport system ATP-binding protein
MLEIKNVSKSYDKKKLAIDGISMSLEPGDLYGFVGPNGAGKTTLLKSIAGIISFDVGSINLNGATIAANPLAFKRQMAYIPDHPDLYESLSGRQFIDFIADAFDVSFNRRNELIGKYAAEFELLDALDKPISTYSHGMKQKTALIGALVHEPKLILLDEPFVGLDPKAAFALKQTFKEITDQGAIILFSSHVLEVVEKLCNKIAIIKQGQIIADGRTHDVLKDRSLENVFMEIA